MAKTAGILVIGNELLSGKAVDENSPFLARELRDLGVDVRRITVIGDDVSALAAETAAFSRAFDHVFTTGGVGPTHDDVTMEAIARAFERPLARSSELVSALAMLYPPECLEANLRMADVPAGARLVGPGLVFPVIAVENVYIFPGVPEILRRKFTRIRELFREAPFRLREIYLRDDEGRVAPALNRVLDQFPDLMLGSYPYLDNPDYSIKITLESKDASYLERASVLLLEELSKIDVKPVNSGL
ncbi:MAG TPA: molybdopterin-binding protein [Terriglobia bacterium]|nr:molybdopterin-binding protein [Terriglobia bacterium]